MIRGATYLDDSPCKACGSNERYLATNKCLTCQADANRRYKARQAEKKGVIYRMRESRPHKSNKGAELRISILTELHKVIGEMMNRQT